MWLVNQGTVITDFGESTLTPGLFAGVDVMIVGWLSRPYTAEEGAVLREWIECGGGVMMMNGYDPDPVAAQTPYNTVLAGMGLAFTGPLLSGTVEDWGDHPVAAGIGAIGFVGGYSLVASDPSEVIAQVSDEKGTYPIAVAHEQGLGRMVIWGDEWIKYDALLSDYSDVTQLWINIFNWIAPTKSCVIPQ